MGVGSEARAATAISTSPYRVTAPALIGEDRARGGQRCLEMDLLKEIEELQKRLAAIKAKIARTKKAVGRR
jgi:uncharacterized small protein (DUF1192 family)